MISRDQLIEAYRRACELDIATFKPGNVSVYSDGHDMTVDQFRTSYQVSAQPLTDPGLSLGEKIYFAIEATRTAVQCNTNLGIVLLSAPLIQAASFVRRGQQFTHVLQHLLSTTTLEDAEWVYKAIRLAAPGGLGDADLEDVRQPPAVSLTAAMALAADKDKVAYQFAYGYEDIFKYTVLMYNSMLAKTDDTHWAALAVYCGWLARFPDSHIERKYGRRYSAWVKEEMERINSALSTTSNPVRLLPMLYKVDRAFKAKGINPGTTADITVATVLVVFLEQLINRQNR